MEMTIFAFRLSVTSRENLAVACRVPLQYKKKPHLS